MIEFVQWLVEDWKNLVVVNIIVFQLGISWGWGRNISE